jgi:hypothetical protein
LSQDIFVSCDQREPQQQWQRDSKAFIVMVVKHQKSAHQVHR